MAPLSVTPGLRAPLDPDPFLLPLIKELQQLHTGIPVIDSAARSRFLLKAHLVLTTGDTPAISKILHLSGHNALSPLHDQTRPLSNLLQDGEGAERAERGVSTQ